MVDQAELDAFLKRLSDFTHTEVQKYKATRYPNAKTGKLLEPEILKPDYAHERQEHIFSLCDACRVKNSCSKDYPDISYSTNNSHKTVFDCSHIQDINEPLVTEKCWICGNENCDAYITVNRTEFNHPDIGNLLTLPTFLVHLNLSTVSIIKTQYMTAVHYNCIQDEEEISDKC